MKVILIDDEQLALKYLEYQLNMIGGFEIIGKYTDPMIGKRAVEENDIDIVFLDIRIPELNGIELAERLLEQKPELNVVFITTYEQYAIKAFELNALDYVLKPVRLERLKLTTQRIKQLKAEPDRPTPLSQILSIQLFGHFMLVDHNQKSITLQFRTSKAQELFFFLLHHRDKVVSKALLNELLWPDFDIAKASSQLYTAVYHIRKTIEPFSDRIILHNAAEGYVLKVNQIAIDVVDVDQFLQKDITLSSNTVEEYERILGVMKDEYLEGFQFDWAEYERQRYQMQYIRLMLNLVNWYYQQEEFEKAFKLCDNLCSRFPLEEHAQLMYLKISDKMGYDFLIQRQYQLYKSLLENEYKEKPDDELTRWYQSWENKQ